MTPRTNPGGQNSNAATDRPHTGSTAASRLLTGVVVVGSLLVSTGAAYESWYAFREMAIMFGWPVDHAWVIMPLVETFFFVGFGEAALRVLDNPQDKARGPKSLAYSALLATLAVNIAYHVLHQAAAAHVPTWWLAIAGAFGALVPLAQLFAVHMLIGRLQRIAAGRASRANGSARPSLMALMRDRAVAAIAARLETAPGAPDAAAPATAGAPDAHIDNTEARVDADAPDALQATDARAEQAADARANRGSKARANRADSGDAERPSRRRADKAARIEQAYAEYVAHVEQHGTEPDGGTVARWVGVQHAGSGRKARDELRARYARELASGARPYPRQLPDAVAALLSAEERTRAAEPDGAPEVGAPDAAPEVGARDAAPGSGAPDAAPEAVPDARSAEELVAA